MIKERLRKLLSGDMRTPIIAIIVIVIINIILQDSFFSAYTFRSNMSTFLPLILLSVGQAIVLISGEIDLSIGSAVSLVNVVCASVLINSPGAVVPAILIGIICGVACGALNGFVVNFFRLPSMVATFATSSIYFGIALSIMTTSQALPDTGIAKQYSGYMIGGFAPIALFIMIGAVAFWYILKRYRIVRYIYAVGDNEKAALASGIKTVAVKASAYMLCGLFVGISGFVLTMQFAYGDAYSGSVFSLLTIAAAVIGGVAIEGGKGSIIGAVIGAIVFGLLTNVIYYAHLSTYFQEFIRGVIIIAALGAAILMSVGRKKKQTLKEGGDM